MPAAFFAAALVGMALERSVIRLLYGRPLETLLATWGISLILIQTVRTLFGAQNVQVENPVWMSGGVEILRQCRAARGTASSSSALPLAVLLLVWFAARAHPPRPVRARASRRTAAWRAASACRPRAWTRSPSRLGSGIAGLAGCALSQIGNVGPDLGQGYIVDSFMVVVLGGVGQLAGTVYAALGLGMVGQVPRRLVGRGAGQDRHARVHHHFHPEAAAGPVRPQGPHAPTADGTPSHPPHHPAATAAKAGALLGAVRADRCSCCCRSLNLVVPEGSAFHISDYTVALIGKIMCYAIVALAMDLIWGYTGILSLGHGLFFALGGYAMGMYLMRRSAAKASTRATCRTSWCF